MKRIEDVYYEIKDGVLCPVLNLTKSSREHTWVTFEQIALEYPEAIEMMAFVLYKKEYNTKSKDFVRSLLFFLEVDQHLSWKQFDSIFFLFESYDAYKNAYNKGTVLRKSGNLIAAKRGKHSFVGRIDIVNNVGPIATDKQFDSLYCRIFGHQPVFEEQFDDGEPIYDVAYRDDGSRMFLLPTEESLKKDSIDAFLSSHDRYAVAAFFNKDLR